MLSLVVSDRSLRLWDRECLSSHIQGGAYGSGSACRHTFRPGSVEQGTPVVTHSGRGLWDKERLPSHIQGGTTSRAGRVSPEARLGLYGPETEVLFTKDRGVQSHSHADLYVRPTWRLRQEVRHVHSRVETQPTKRDTGPDDPGGILLPSSHLDSVRHPTGPISNEKPKVSDPKVEFLSVSGRRSGDRHRSLHQGLPPQRRLRPRHVPGQNRDSG